MCEVLARPTTRIREGLIMKTAAQFFLGTFAVLSMAVFFAQAAQPDVKPVQPVKIQCIGCGAMVNGQYYSAGT